jgi:hypothetical protein
VKASISRQRDQEKASSRVSQGENVHAYIYHENGEKKYHIFIALILYVFQSVKLLIAAVRVHLQC